MDLDICLFAYVIQRKLTCDNVLSSGSNQTKPSIYLRVMFGLYKTI